MTKWNKDVNDVLADASSMRTQIETTITNEKKEN